MIHLGDFATSSVVYIPFDSFAAATGAPSATTNFAAGDVLIFKDGSTTQRSSSAGITVSTSFDSNTGLQLIAIDLADNTDAGFYVAGHEYQVAVADITVDGQTLRFWAATFSIERAGAVLALIKANTVKVDVHTVKTQTVTCGAGVTVLASVGTAATSTAQTGDGYAVVSSGTHGNAALKTLIDAVDDFLDTEIAAILAAVDTEVGAIKTKTDSLTFTVAGQVDANIQRVNDVALVGDGSGTPWGP